MSRVWLAALPILVLVFVGCGPTSPSGALDVEGVYSGTLDFDPAFGDKLAFGARVFVTQNNTQLKVTGDLLYQNGKYALTETTGPIEASGRYSPSVGIFAGNAAVAPECGRVTAISTTITFSGSNAAFSEEDRTEQCGGWKVTGNLVRGPATP